MKVSTRGRYGLQLLIDLSENKQTKYISLGSVSERQGISVRYLEYVAILLKKHGILTSSKGVAGGYALNKEPAHIKIGEVLRILEDGMTVIAPLSAGETESPYRCTVRKVVFNTIDGAIGSLIDSLSLEQLAKR